MKEFIVLIYCFTVLLGLSLAVQPFNIVSIDNFEPHGVGMYSQVRVSAQSNDVPILSYYNATCGSLFVVECLDEFCLDPIYNTIDGSCNEEVFTGKFSNQVIGSDGLPFFSYCEIGGPYDNIKVAHCGDLYCSNPNNITINTIGHSFSGYTTIAIGNDGFPRVAYYNTYSRQLEIVSCGDMACDSSIISKVATGGEFYGYLSMAIGSDSNPIISFYNEDREILQVLHCSDRRCENRFGIDIITLDNSADVGRYNYLEIGSDGNPIIMYVDETNGWMKLAHCNTPICDDGSISIIDDIGEEAFGEFPEIQINPINGLAVLSYSKEKSSTRSSLVVTQCKNINCTSSLVQELHEGETGYGRDSSMAFSNNYLYLSFLKYSEESLLRQASLAILEYV